jgi:hypothetical protein
LAAAGASARLCLVPPCLLTNSLPRPILLAVAMCLLTSPRPGFRPGQGRSS